MASAARARPGPMSAARSAPVAPSGRSRDDPSGSVTRIRRVRLEPRRSEMADELWRRGAGELAGMIASGQVSSREVVDAHLERIAEVNPQLNAIVVVLEEQARAAADAADSNPGPRGPL